MIGLPSAPLNGVPCTQLRSHAASTQRDEFSISSDVSGHSSLYLLFRFSIFSFAT